MKKVLFALLFLMSTLSFAGTINYYNQSDGTVQFLRDGSAPGPGSNVIPGGYYSETMPNGNYHLSATNGTETTAGFDCTLNADNQRCDYSVYTSAAYVAPYGMKYTAVSDNSPSTQQDWRPVPGGPFNRSGVAPYNVFYSPSSILRWWTVDGSVVGVVSEAVPTDGTPTRYTAEAINCSMHVYSYSTWDAATETWSDASEAKDIVPNTAIAYTEPLICQ
jgi:hypothetical protein